MTAVALMMFKQTTDFLHVVLLQLELEESLANVRPSCTV